LPRWPVGDTTIFSIRDRMISVAWCLLVSF